MSLQQGPYNPIDSEKKILKYWIENKFYKPEYNPKTGKVETTSKMKQTIKEKKIDTYCTINPPPNAYARPHLGNISGYAYQDAFARFARIKGKKVLMIPGKDHAAQQAEAVYIREVLKPKGKNKKDFSREQFFNMCYNHFTKIMKIARQDEMRVGLSADFDRDLFTLDPEVVKIITKTFIELFTDKMVYKGVRIVNWCPNCQTALADLDTERESRTTNLTYIKYPIIPKNVKVWYLSFYKKDILNAIIDGKKIIETRALNPEEPERYFGNIKKGDLIVCVNKSKNMESHLCIVNDIKIYKDLVEFLQNKDLKEIYPKGQFPKNVNELVRYYNTLVPGYGDKIRKNGIVTIYIKATSYSDTRHIEVATTRPETMLGDTAVIVNPKDPRYKDLIGEKVILPLLNREIPIITSGRVDMEFGTGAVKLTPAHSYDDYLTMLEWNETNPNKKVGYINVISKEKKMVGPVGKYFGMNVEECRDQVLKNLEEQGLILKKEKIEQNISVCERCKTIIEPLMSSQWFIDTDALKKPAIEAVEKNIVKIYPNYMKNKLLHWLYKLRDWPISRSIWWGYRFPVWYAGEPSEFTDENGQVRWKIGDKEINSMKEAIDKGLMKVQVEKPTNSTKGEPTFGWYSKKIPPKANQLLTGITKNSKITVLCYDQTNNSKLHKLEGKDNLLNNTGIKEAEKYTKSLKENFDLIITSTLKPAKQTAKIIGKLKNIKVIENKLLNEKDFEKFEGKTLREVKKNDPELSKENNNVYQQNIQDRKIIKDVEERVRNFISEIQSKYSDKKLLIITHAGIIRILKRVLDGVSYEESRKNDPKNCKVIKFNFNLPAKNYKLQTIEWFQDPDVFDTWFSSGQWAFAPLMKENLYDTFYPTTVMETGYDILELWVSRMIMLGIYRSKKEGKKNFKNAIPFRSVYLHGLIKAADGQKMSKSKGNIVYPDDIINKFGADTLRLFYIVGNKAGAAYRVDDRKIKGFRNFLNKIWNASKFVLANQTMSVGNRHDFSSSHACEIYEDDKKIIEYVDNLEKNHNNHMKNFRIGIAAEELQKSFWHTFCDKYIESTKKRLYDKNNKDKKAKQNRKSAEYTLLYCLKKYLKMLHPIVPFITERIWQELPKGNNEHESIMFRK